MPGLQHSAKETMPRTRPTHSATFPLCRVPAGGTRQRVSFAECQVEALGKDLTPSAPFAECLLEALGNMSPFTTGGWLFAVCQKHTAKAFFHTAKPLQCVAHGKQASVKRSFAVCHLSGTRQILPSAKKNSAKKFSENRF